MMLVHFSMKELSRALSVSKYCRDVILGHRGLRQKLFLEAAQRTEYLTTEKIPAQDDQNMILHVSYTPLARNVIVQKLDQDSRNGKVIVEVHPVLERCRHDVPWEPEEMSWMSLFCPQAHLLRHRSPSPDCSPDGSFLETKGISCDMMERVPAEAFLFQPPVTKVNMYHQSHLVSLERSEGVTFGMVAEQLRKIKAEDTQYLQELISSVSKVPCTRARVQDYATVTELLDASRDGNLCTSLGMSCLYFEVQGVISKDSMPVKRARGDWWTAR
jgi:hypothetical protein